MSYSLYLVRVPPGASDEEVEKIALAENEAESDRAPKPPDPEAARQKRALAEALLAEFPELDGGEPNYAELARAHDITADEARQRFPWWRVTGPEDGAGIEIVLYDTFATLAALVGLFLLFRGIFDITVAFVTKDEFDLWWLQLIAGIAQILLAFWVAGNWRDKAILLVVYVGIVALMRGITEIFLAFKLKGVRKRLAAS